MSNADRIFKDFGSDEDFRIRELQAGGNKISIVWLDGVANSDRLSDFVAHAIILLDREAACPDDIIKDNVFLIGAEKESRYGEMTDKLLAGFSLLFIGGYEDAIVLDTQIPDGRSISEPPTSGVTKGPREGFVENLRTNINLIRKRLKTEHFKQESLNVGKYTQTKVAVCYIEGVADKTNVDTVIRRLSVIDTDGILDSSYIARFLDKSKTSLFKMVGSVEKPDIVVGKMLEGRIAVVVDGSPIVLTLPYMFIEDLQTAEDYYISNETATMSRYIRLISVLASVLIPGLYVSLQMYNYQIIPLTFLITIINATKNIPFSPLSEMILVLIIFDILREANFRMPRFAGLALSVVGAVVLGDAAVSAGLLGAPAVMIGALSGIGLYTLPDNTLLFTLTRLVITVIGGILGVFGILAAGIALLAYMASLNAYNTPYLAPFAPDIPEDRKDALTKSSVYKLDTRPLSIGSKNRVRLKIEKDEEKNDEISRKNH